MSESTVWHHGSAEGLSFTAQTEGLALTKAPDTSSIVTGERVEESRFINLIATWSCISCISFLLKKVMPWSAESEEEG